ncbi:hypothetical protein VNO80_19343 [Phaseolus coccineus]|uniref:Uncharacterized protein n=1 Tax=Phaseolus coccineus TaxID=3886 RepID=A0AAN9MFV1_PHACN
MPDGRVILWCSEMFGRMVGMSRVTFGSRQYTCPPARRQTVAGFGPLMCDPSDGLGFSDHFSSVSSDSQSLGDTTVSSRLSDSMGERDVDAKDISPLVCFVAKGAKLDKVDVHDVGAKKPRKEKDKDKDLVACRQSDKVSFEKFAIQPHQEVEVDPKPL